VSYVRAALRFYWIGLFGLAAALLVLVLMVYHVKRTWPPLLVKKAVPTYLATTELLVDSPSGPYLRTAPGRTLPTVPAAGKRSSSQPSAPAVTTNQTSVTPTKPLVDAANLFPLLIQSDAVARLRVERFGNTPGAVSAKALYAAQGANRYRPSMLPVMQISAISGTPANAIRLSETTAQAFGIWLTRQQTTAHVPLAQRIVVRPLRVPQGAVPLGGAHYGLPVVLALALFAAFLGLAVVADHFFPRQGEFATRASIEDAEEDTHASLTIASRSSSS
jgi:hypothetical protein